MRARYVVAPAPQGAPGETRREPALANSEQTALTFRPARGTAEQPAARVSAPACAVTSNESVSRGTPVHSSAGASQGTAVAPPRPLPAATSKDVTVPPA